jgi:hypothetical protein
MTVRHHVTDWPALDYRSGRATIDALHMRTQVVGKVKLALTRTAPQWQNAPLLVNGRGLTTGLLPSATTNVEIAFDLVEHRLRITTSDGRVEELPLAEGPLRRFTADVLRALERIGVGVVINPVAVEVPNVVRLDVEDGYDAYDPDVANQLFRIWARTTTVLDSFRAGFWGKHATSFWWGTFDLAVTRYNLAPVAPRAGADLIERTAMDSEHIIVGFWPGDHRYDQPAFFAYTYPHPHGLENASILPDRARWDANLGEFILDYEEVLGMPDPREAILAFADSTYGAGADIARWNRELVERRPPR